MNSALKIVLMVAAVLFAASAAALIAISMNSGAGEGPAARDPNRSAEPLQPDPAAVDLSLPAFELVSQDGQSVTNEAFQGKLTVVDFVFTNCPLVCPMMTGTMSELADRLNGTGVQFLSISVDPDRDTPEKLREFGQTYGADFSRWTFARGDKDATWRIVRDGLMFAIEDDEELVIPLPDGSTMLNIRHPSHFVLVGPTGRVLGLYSATDEAAVKALEARARAGAAELRRG